MQSRVTEWGLLLSNLLNWFRVTDEVTEKVTEENL